LIREALGEAQTVAVWFHRKSAIPGEELKAQMHKVRRNQWARLLPDARNEHGEKVAVHVLDRGDFCCV
jgi:hypothetical protein